MFNKNRQLAVFVIASEQVQFGGTPKPDARDVAIQFY